MRSAAHHITISINMEKYSKWRDPGTGIHPFLPNKVETDYDNVWKILWWLKRLLLGPVLVIVRLPFILGVFLWLLLFSFIAQLMPITFIQRALNKSMQFLGARALLWLLGFWWIETRNFNISRQKRDANAGAPGSRINSGDVIIANHVSYVDILYFTFRFSPVFTAVPNTWQDEPPKGVVLRRGLIGALVDAIRFPVHESGQSLPDVISTARSYMQGPIVVFPEGTTTNGRTILANIPALSSEEALPPRARVHIVGLKYDYQDFSPAFTVGSFLWHFLRLIAQVHNKMEVRYLSEADTPPLPLDGTGREPTPVDREEWSDALHRTLAAVLQIRKATLNTLDKREFLAYWYSHKKTYKGKRQ